MENVWKTDQQIEWEKIRDKAFKKTLELFLEFMKSQNQIEYAEDLINGFTYTHMTSWNKIDICRCILWNGVLLKPDEDAQLNIEIDSYSHKTKGRGETRIYHHEKGKPLTEGWYIAKEITSDDMINQLRKDGCLP